jgi:UDP-galactose transporter B1
MARSKPQTPVRRTPSETFKQANGTSHTLNDVIENVEKEIEDAAEVHARDPVEQKQAGLGTLLFCVGGIYASL